MATPQHKDLTGADAIHPSAYVQAGDPGAVGAGKHWWDTTAGAGGWILKVRDVANTGWDTGTSAPASTLDGLSDVVITAAASGDILRHNGTNWVDAVGTTHFAAASHASAHENGGADELSVTGLSGILVDPQDADTIITTSGPTALVVGAIADGEYTKRVGSTLVGGTPPGGGGSGRPLVDPTGLSWSWVNQGSATITVNGASLALNSPADAADSSKLRVKAVPAKPYTIIIRHSIAAIGANYSGGSIGWLQSSNNFFAGCFQVFDTALGQVVSVKKSGTNYSITADYLANVRAYDWFPWVKLTDAAGGNRTVSVSRDGYNWILLHSVATDDFITPDRLYFGVNPMSATFAAGVTIDSWEEI